MTTRSETAVPFEKRIRPFLIAFIVLPISVLLTIKVWIQKNLLKHENDPNDHDSRVQRIINQIKNLAITNNNNTTQIINLRTDRDSSESHSVRISKKSNSNKIKLRDLNCILELNLERGIIRLEPGVTVGEVTSYLVARNLQLEATLEMEDATLGGLALSQGMTTHSHVCGLVADTCESFEFISGDGTLHKTKKGDDLHRAMMFSHGSLGVLVALELRIVPAERFVKIQYIHVETEQLPSAFQSAISERNPFFLEAIIFSPSKAVVIQGHLTRDTDKTTKLQVNRQGQWWKEWYFKHVEKSRNGQEELMPMRDYLMRHDRSMCMTMETVFPIGNEPWFRYLFGWTLPPKISFLKASHTEKTRMESVTAQVYQDVAFPLESFTKIWRFVDETFTIYPLLCYPCKMMNHSSMIRFGENDQTTGSDRMFMNLGIYGVPKPLKEGHPFPTLKKVRELESLVREVGGFQHTYCDTLQTREEFEQMFDHTALIEARKLVHSGNLPMVYDKVKPELDIPMLLKMEGELIST